MRLTFLADHAGVEPGTFADEVVAVTRAFVQRGLDDATLPSWFADDDTGRCSAWCPCTCWTCRPHGRPADA